MKPYTAISREQQKKVVAEMYGLRRVITDKELDDEIAMLRRKDAKGTLDDMCEMMAIRLGII
jgi:hypothetical protein